MKEYVDMELLKILGSLSCVERDTKLLMEIYRKEQQEIRKIITEYAQKLKANPENENEIIEEMFKKTNEVHEKADEQFKKIAQQYNEDEL